MISVEDYDRLLECWRSGQISDAAMQQHMTADPLFRTWLLEHLRFPSDCNERN